VFTWYLNDKKVKKYSTLLVLSHDKL